MPMRKRPDLTEHGFDRWAEQLGEWIRASVSPFEGDTPALQAERKERARWDRLFFFQTYLPHYFFADFAPFHQEWSSLADVIEQAVLIAAPREHAKSVFFSFGVPIHDICFSLKHFIIIISDTNDQATGFTMPIQLELEENPRLIHDFGLFRGRVWKRDDFVTAQGIRVWARGHTDKVRGQKYLQYRPDRVIVDDFENDQNVRNPKIVDAGIKWLKGAVIGSLGVNYSFSMVGNLFASRSVLSQLMAETDEDGEKKYISRIYRAVLEDGRPLWPELWPLKRLEKKRRDMGTVAFNKEMLNQVGAEESPFKESWFVFIDHPLRGTGILPVSHGQPFDRLMALSAVEGDGHATIYRVASFLDPSAKSGLYNDFKSLITVGLNPMTMIFDVLHAWIRHATPSEMIDQCYRQMGQYGGQLGIEINMLEDFLRQPFDAAARERQRYLPLVEVRHTTQKEGRIISALSPLIEFGKLRFVKGHSDQDILVEQLIYILDKNVNDDGPDALEGAVNLLQTMGGPPDYHTIISRRRFAEQVGAY